MISENDSLKLYMLEISRYTLVSRQEEADLAAAIRAGSQEARQHLIRSNLRLVVKIAHDFKGRGVPLVDLIAEGNIGLMHAVGKFDPSRGAKLSSYSSWWIKQSMRRAIANQSRTVRIPIQSAAKLAALRTARTALNAELQREPTQQELAARTGLTRRTVGSLAAVHSHTVSLDAPIGEGDDGRFGDLVADANATPPDEELGASDDLSCMVELVRFLDPREQTVIRRRFGLNGFKRHTLGEISVVIGRTRERVRQIQNVALGKLRYWIEAGPPPDTPPGPVPR